jgi:hypothetical protein
MRSVGKSIPQKIEASRTFNTGSSFGPMRLLDELKKDSPNLTRKRVLGALDDMDQVGRVWRVGRGLYIKPRPRHWIHRQRLSAARVVYFAERCWRLCEET